jgi:Tol biopolymer transport system component/tRNA A-37 threonylcarbamoyl transferase component Bud32
MIGRLTAALAERYRVERKLGEGGMATVYLADDLKHDRRVAIKVLKPELAAVIGAERFLAEIRTTANLQHPHILPLFDSGAVEGFLFYVMPYVEGESLRERLDRETQLGVEEAVGIATDVAEALDYAHRQGVIHRDVKPANILLHDGRPLVADFGIALALTAAGQGRMTETGLSLGTPHYMSPEQATADRDLTSRADVYSLGAVLYEMLVGEPPHTGPTGQAVLVKILTDEVRPITDLRKSVPRHVAAAVMKALEKLPADRWSSAADFAEALARPEMTATPMAATAGPAATGPHGLFGNVPFLAAMSVAALTGAVALWSLTRPEPGAPVSRFSIALPADQAIEDQGGTTAELSPDGRRFVYVGPGDNGPQLWLREMNQLSATPIPGTEGASSPFFSPDGQSVAYFTSGSLHVVSLEGGPPVTLVEDSLYYVGGAWGDDGFLYVIEAGPDLDPVVRLSPSGAPPDTVAVPDTTAGREFAWPDVLPNGAGVLFTTHSPSGLNEDAEIAVASVATGEVTTILEGVRARYVEPGLVVYARDDGALLAAPFDAEALEVTGPSTPLLQGVLTKGIQAAEFSIARDGSLLYLKGERSEQLVWVDRDGGEQAIDIDAAGDIESMALSPDGGRAAVSVVGEQGENIWIAELEQGTISRLTFQGEDNQRPEWLPEGRELTFISVFDGSRGLYTMPADGSARPRLTVGSQWPVWEASWSRDGRYLVYRVTIDGDGRDIRYRERGDSTERVFLATEFDEWNPKISPGGRWLAYVSDESGRDEVYVRPFPGPGGRWQISRGGGTEPLWSRDGSEIFYRSLDGYLVSAAVTAGEAFLVGQRTVLFSAEDYSTSRNHTHYDISPDGQRFLMVKRTGGSPELILVQNWVTEVLERMGR